MTRPDLSELAGDQLQYVSELEETNKSLTEANKRMRETLAQIEGITQASLAGKWTT